MASDPPAPTPETATPAAIPASPRQRSAHNRIRIINLFAVILPFAGVLAAAVLTWGVAFDWVHLAILLGMGLVTSFGITVGFHRLFTHKSFTTYAPVRYLFAVMGSMAAEGPVIEWAATHRRHHQHSDDHEDPHSPHIRAGGSWGTGIWATIRGAFHAHMGWLFVRRQKGLARYTRDLYADPVVAAANKQFPFWVLMGLVIPMVLGALLTWSFTGALLGLVWGGLVRVFIVHHITWSVNSVCHLWGTQPFRSHDESRNNAVVAILGLGEGWHNNHHAFPTSARHGLRWWEVDISYLLIRAMALVGLAWNIKTPTPERLAAKRNL